MEAESSASRASRIEIVPRSGKLTLCQRLTRRGRSRVCVESLGAKSPWMIRVSGILLDPVKRKRGGRCCKNSCLSGVSSLRTAFRILEGNLPARRSSRSTIWRSDGGFTNVAVSRAWDLSACETSWVENRLSNSNLPRYKISHF